VDPPQAGTVAYLYPALYPTNSFWMIYTPTGAVSSDSFTFRASDGGLHSGVATCRVAVVTNTAPNAWDCNATVVAGRSKHIDLSGYDPQLDRAELRCIITNAPTHGTVTWQFPALYPTNSYRVVYTPEALFTGTDTFAYVMNDGLLNSMTATCTVVVVTNTPPRANGNTLSAAAGTPCRTWLSGNDAETWNSELEFIVTTPPVHGNVKPRYPDDYPQNSYQVCYTPEVGFTGTDTFTFVANDWDLDSNIATCTVSVVSNGVPVATNMTANATEQTPATILLGVSDPNTSAWELECIIVSPPADGTVTYQNPGNYPQNSYQVYYTPNAGFTGTNTFTYQCTDGEFWSAIATCKVVVAANTPPVAFDQWIHADPGQTTTQYQVSYQESDTGQTMTFFTNSLPAHGHLIGASFAGGGYFQYAADAGYSGVDSFTWSVTDGIATSAPATCRVLVHAPSSRTNQLVLVVVETNLFPNVSNEVVRLRDDLIAEGYESRITQWRGGGATSASNLWDYLRGEYATPGQFLVGTILIGDVPKAQEYNPASSYGGWVYTDLVYWNLKSFQTQQSWSVTRSIWVSRIIATSGYGTEITMIKRALQANHDYRTGASRLPHTAYYYMIPEWWGSYGSSNNVAALQQVWTNCDSRGVNGSQLRFLPGRSDIGNICGADCFVAGGEVFDETSHGNEDGYMGMSGWFTRSDLHRILAQLRFGVIASCTSGAYDGIVNNTIFTRGGGCVFAIGGSAINWSGDFQISESGTEDVAFRQRVAAGESLGTAAVQHYAFDSQYNDRTLFYGDLSFRAMAAPSNALPAISSFNVSTIPDHPPFTAHFSVAASDPDSTISNIEWFCNGFNAGQATPTYTGTGTNISHTFASAGSYTVRVEVMDQWKAREWREMTVTVNTKPVASNDVAYTVANHAVTVSVLANDYDPDAQALSIFSFAQGANGAVTQSGNALIYTPATNWTGTDAFAYTIHDTFNSSASATVTVTVAGDVTPPALESASALGDSNVVTVTFDEKLEPGAGTHGSENLSNYTLDHGIAILGAVLQPGAKAVKLTTSSMVTGVVYTLTVTNVADIAVPANPMAWAPRYSFQYGDLVSGMAYECYHGSWTGGGTLPDFDSLTPVTNGTVATFSIAPRLRDTDFAFRYRGRIKIDTAGTYTFYTSSDDGSRLYLAGSLLVDNDGPHGTQERSGVTNLAVGVYDIGVGFCQGGGGFGLTVSWEGPGIGKDEIPSNVLYCVGSTPTLPDADGDTLPDAWEQAHGVHGAGNHALLDSDGDGLNNAQEFVAGTDPGNAGSSIEFSALAPNGANLGLTFCAISGHWYSVFWKTNLLSTNWLEYAHFLGTSSAPVSVTFTNNVHDAFFRIGVGP